MGLNKSYEKKSTIVCTLSNEETQFLTEMSKILNVMYENNFYT